MNEKRAKGAKSSPKRTFVKGDFTQKMKSPDKQEFETHYVRRIFSIGFPFASSSIQLAFNLHYRGFTYFASSHKCSKQTSGMAVENLFRLLGQRPKPFEQPRGRGWLCVLLPCKVKTGIYLYIRFYREYEVESGQKVSREKRIKREPLVAPEK